MKNQFLVSGLMLFGFNTFTGTCHALEPFSDDFNAPALDTGNWLPGSYRTGARLKLSKGRVNFIAPVANPKESDAWLELHSRRPGYNENWQAIVDVVNRNHHRGKSSTGLWIFNGEDRRDAVFFELFGSGKKEGFGASFVVDGKYTAGSDLEANPRVNKGSLRISFNSKTKILTFWYDKTGSADGYKWKKLGTFATNGEGGDRRGDWMMNDETGAFVIEIAGYVQGKVVGPGTESMDNFVLKPLK